MAQVFRHQNNGHRRNQQHGTGAENRRGKARQAYPCSIDNRQKIHRLAQPQAIGQHRINERCDNQAHQNQQALHHAARHHRNQCHADKSHHLHPGIKITCRHGFDRNTGQAQTNYRHHRAGDHRRHEAFDPAGTHRLHDSPYKCVEHAAGNDAPQRHADIGIRPLAGVSRGGNHHTDEGKARPQVAGYLAAGDYKKDQRADTAHQDGDIRIKPHQQRRQYRGAKHGNDVLHPHHRSLRPRQPLVRGDHAALLQHRAVFFFPAKHTL